MALQTALQEAARTHSSGHLRALSTLARSIQVLGGPGIGAPEAQEDLAAARAAIGKLLWQSVRGTGMSMLEVLASSQFTTRVLAHGGGDLYGEAVRVNANSAKAATYRHSDAWKTSRVATTDLDIFQYQRVWPPAIRPVHEVAVGFIEGQLQRFARAVSPDPRGLMMAGSQTWHSNAVGSLTDEHVSLARRLLDIVAQQHGVCTLAQLQAQYQSDVGQLEATAALAPDHVQAALSSFLSRAPALHIAPRLPLGPRGAPTWAPALSKDDGLYMAIRNAVPATPCIQSAALCTQPATPCAQPATPFVPGALAARGHAWVRGLEPRQRGRPAPGRPHAAAPVRRGAPGDRARRRHLRGGDHGTAVRQPRPASLPGGARAPLCSPAAAAVVPSGAAARPHLEPERRADGLP